MAKNQHNAGLHYRPLNQLGLSNFNDYIENPIDSRFLDFAKLIVKKKSFRNIARGIRF